MTRVLGVGALLLAAGCASRLNYYTPPADAPPGPIDLGGSQVVVEDRRPDWEKKPFTGPVNLYHLGRVTPSPWAQVARETEAVVRAMPDRPEKVEVAVTSYRLVRRNGSGGPAIDDSKPGTFTPPDPGNPYNPRLYSPNSVGTSSSRPPSAEIARDQRPVREDAADKDSGSMLGWVSTEVFGINPNDEYPKEVLAHPPGASCELKAEVRMTFPGGRQQVVPVSCIASGQNLTQSQYWGEALESAVQQTSFQYRRQLRKGAGLPED